MFILKKNQWLSNTPMRLHTGYIKTENKEDFETMLHLPFSPKV